MNQSPPAFDYRQSTAPLSSVYPLMRRPEERPCPLPGFEVAENCDGVAIASQSGSNGPRLRDFEQGQLVYVFAMNETPMDLVTISPTFDRGSACPQSNSAWQRVPLADAELVKVHLDEAGMRLAHLGHDVRQPLSDAMSSRHAAAACVDDGYPTWETLRASGDAQDKLAGEMARHFVAQGLARDCTLVAELVRQLCTGWCRNAEHDLDVQAVLDRLGEKMSQE